jgi:hypothetical protein
LIGLLKVPNDSLPIFMPESVNASAFVSPASPSELADWESKLTTGAEKTQLQAIAELAGAGAEGYAILESFLRQFKAENTPPTFIEGRCYERLLQLGQADSFLQQEFPQGIVPLLSEGAIDYQALQQALARQDFQDADRITTQKLCELAGDAASKRKWLYFTEVDSLPITDLKTINQLWLVHSEGKFGFSVQRQLWLGVGKNWEALWPKLKWKSDKTWTRYPNEFIWNLSAPKGHLPLSNQLRGVQVFNALLSHPAWAV